MSDAMSNFQEIEVRNAMFGNPATVWAASTAYSVGDLVVPLTGTPSEWVYKCVLAGTSDVSEPTWSTTWLTEFSDNTVQWEALKISYGQRPLFVALFGPTSSLSNLESGSFTGEISGNGYARQQLDPSSTNWTGSAGNVTNATAISFPVATGNWNADVRYVALIDTVGSSSEVIMAGQLANDRTVLSGQVFQFSIADLSITIS